MNRQGHNFGQFSLNVFVITFCVLFVMTSSIGFIIGAQADPFEEDFVLSGDDFIEYGLEADIDAGVQMIGHMRIEDGGSATITVKGEIYDCIIFSLHAEGIFEGDATGSLNAEVPRTA